MTKIKGKGGVILFVIFVLGLIFTFVGSYFQPVYALMADAAKCESGGCRCACEAEDGGCMCIASNGTCKCECANGTKSSCD